MAGISMRELAEVLGVSVASVSVALRGKPGISQETRARVLAEAKKRGYDMGRLSMPDTKGTIEIIDYTYYHTYSDTEKNPYSYYNQFVDVVTASITEHGYTVSGPYTPADTGFEARPPADGSILLGSGMTESELLSYQRRKAPFVIAGNLFDHFPVTTVSHDNNYGIMAAVSHLVSLGHTRIGYLRSMRGAAGKARWHAFRHELAKCNLEPSDYLDIQAPSETPELPRQQDKTSASERMLCQINSWLSERLPEATAFLCDNDFVAASLMRSLRDHGLLPGSQISIIGFDDQPFSALLEPPLTTIHTYEPELGTACVEQLIYSLNHPGFHFRHVKIGTELIVRNSTQHCDRL